jgi:hypothetical protein
MAVLDTDNYYPEKVACAEIQILNFISMGICTNYFKQSSFTKIRILIKVK